jgi:hypothetical protein
MNADKPFSIGVIKKYMREDDPEIWKRCTSMA